MKYRIVFSKRGERISRKATPRLRGRDTLSRYSRIQNDTLVEFAELFDFGPLYEPYSEPPPKTLRGRLSYTLGVIRQMLISFSHRVSKTAEKIAAEGQEIIEKRRAKRARKPKLPSLTPTLCGALCASVVVAALSFGVVIYKLVIEDYFGEYQNVTVPDFVGSVYPSGESFENSDFCLIDTNYVYSDLPEGTVISQLPAPNVTRRIYGDRNFCNVTLTVSLGKRSLTMNDYVSHTLRDALLELKNEAVKVKVERVYSDSVEAGRIISTSPEVGNIFPADQPVTLTVSLGKKQVYLTVPNICGLTESRAIAALDAAGLRHGEISYVSSKSPCGTVISQSHAAYSEVKEGELISFEVSAGAQYYERMIPDLYGLTIDEAREKLAEVGLVCGNIYAVANGAPSGTVISQSPLPQTPVSAGIVSVDIYVSSQ